jgi:predicted transposase YdaD
LKTDSIFYRIFQSNPDILFELLGQSPDLAKGREFGSVEIKQVAFRLDGVLFPSPNALACIIHGDFEKASKAFPGNQSGDLLKKQSVF